MTGDIAAEIMDIAIPYTEMRYSTRMDLKAVPELAAGFMYGMIGDSDLKEFKMCYKSTEPLFHYVQDAVEDIKEKKWLQVVEQVKLFMTNFKKDLEPCKNMSDDVQAIEHFFEKFEDPLALAKEVLVNFEQHKDDITKDMELIKSDWGAEKYFETGRATADLVVAVIGPFEED